MDETITAAEANRSFSKLLRAIREGRSYRDNGAWATGSSDRSRSRWRRDGRQSQRGAARSLGGPAGRPTSDPGSATSFTRMSREGSPRYECLGLCGGRQRIATKDGSTRAAAQIVGGEHCIAGADLGRTLQCPGAQGRAISSRGPVDRPRLDRCVSGGRNFSRGCKPPPLVSQPITGSESGMP